MSDDELRKLFGKLREVDARRAPPFDARRTVRSRMRWTVLVPVSSTLAAAALIALLFSKTNDADPSGEHVDSMEGAKLVKTLAPPRDVAPLAPLDFLLTLPSQAMLTRAPTFEARLTFEESAR